MKRNVFFITDNKLIKGQNTYIHMYIIQYYMYIVHNIIGLVPIESLRPYVLVRIAIEAIDVINDSADTMGPLYLI